MRLFALETNVEKLNKGFLSPSEEQIMQVRFHGIRFVFAFIKAIIFSAVLTGIAIASTYGVPTNIVMIATVLVWIVGIGLPLLKAWIDWQYDELLITTEKIIIVNQSSIIRQAIKQMNLDNLATVNAETQYWGLMPFGKLCFDLKEGTGERMCLDYIPHVQNVASVISDTLVKYERRRGMRAL
jgi:hypothetical protein